MNSVPQMEKTLRSRWLRGVFSQRLPLALGLVAIVLGGIYSGWLNRADLLIYDSHQRFWVTPAPEDVVIVAVDEYSLKQLGRDRVKKIYGWLLETDLALKGTHSDEKRGRLALEKLLCLMASREPATA